MTLGLTGSCPVGVQSGEVTEKNIRVSGTQEILKHKQTFDGFTWLLAMFVYTFTRIK